MEWICSLKPLALSQVVCLHWVSSFLVLPEVVSLHWVSSFFSFLGFLFSLPLSIIRFYITEKKNHISNDICVLLCCVNSTANPAVYFFIGGLQQERPTESLKAVLQRALGEETEDAEDQKVIPACKMESMGL